MILVTRHFQFEAAHTIPDHPGKCKNLHGHSYKLVVTVGAEHVPPSGYFIDFAELKEVVNESVIEYLDHRYLNDLTAFTGEVTSAENICQWIWMVLENAFRFQCYQLMEITLYETEDCCVTITRDDPS